MSVVPWWIERSTGVDAVRSLLCECWVARSVIRKVLKSTIKNSKLCAVTGLVRGAVVAVRCSVSCNPQPSVCRDIENVEVVWLARDRSRSANAIRALPDRRVHRRTP